MTGRRTATLLASVALALTAGACGSFGGSGSTSTAPGQVNTIDVDESGMPVGGVGRLGFDRGHRIRLRIRSAVEDVIHVHGYDLLKSVPAGGEVMFAFLASLEGTFTVELEDRGQPIAQLVVQP